MSRIPAASRAIWLLVRPLHTAVTPGSRAKPTEPTHLRESGTHVPDRLEDPHQTRGPRQVVGSPAAAPANDDLHPRCVPASHWAPRTNQASTSACIPSGRPGPATAHGPDHRCEGEANTSHRCGARYNSSSSMHTTYVSWSTAPGGGRVLENTARRHVGGTGSASTSRGSSGRSSTRRRDHTHRGYM